MYFFCFYFACVCGIISLPEPYLCIPFIYNYHIHQPLDKLCWYVKQMNNKVNKSDNNVWRFLVFSAAYFWGFLIGDKPFQNYSFSVLNVSVYNSKIGIELEWIMNLKFKKLNIVKQKRTVVLIFDFMSCITSLNWRNTLDNCYKEIEKCSLPNGRQIIERYKDRNKDRHQWMETQT